MDATTLLTAQHKEVDSLFSQYEKVTTSLEKLSLYRQIADNLAAHMVIEEKLFYPAVFVGELKGKLTEGLEEHLASKRLLADLIQMSPDNEQYDAKVKVLQEQIEHHVHEEQDEIFPMVRELMPKREREALGEAMEAMFNRLIGTAPRNRVPGETDQAPALS